MLTVVLFLAVLALVVAAGVVVGVRSARSEQHWRWRDE